MVVCYGTDTQKCNWRERTIIRCLTKNRFLWKFRFFLVGGGGLCLKKKF